MSTFAQILAVILLWKTSISIPELFVDDPTPKCRFWNIFVKYCSFKEISLLLGKIPIGFNKNFDWVKISADHRTLWPLFVERKRFFINNNDAHHFCCVFFSQLKWIEVPESNSPVDLVTHRDKWISKIKKKRTRNLINFNVSLNCIILCHHQYYCEAKFVLFWFFKKVLKKQTLLVFKY